MHPVTVLLNVLGQLLVFLSNLAVLLYYTVSQKTRHLTLAHNFTKYWPIFKIISPLDSVGNLFIQIPHHTLNVSLVKYLCSKNRHS